MANIINVYQQSVPALAFVGRRYGDSDRMQGGFGHLWDEWFQNGWFAPYQHLIDETFLEQYPEASAPIGLMRFLEGEPFEYWIGMFVPQANNATPEGTTRVELPKTDFGIGWVEGDWTDVFGQEMRVKESLEQAGMTVKQDDFGALWFFERYAIDRFVGTRLPFILDIGFFLSK